MIEKIYSLITNNYEHTDNIENNIYFKSINRHLFLLVLIFLYHSIFYLILLGFNFFVAIHFFMFFYYSFLLMLKKKEYVIVHVDYYTFTSFIVLSTFVAYVSYISNFSRNVEFFYFPILTSIPFFYTIKKLKQIILIVIYIIVLFIIIKIIKPISSYHINNNYEEIISIENFFLCLIATLVNIYFIIEQKESKLKIAYEKIKIEDNLFELENRFSELMKKQFILNNLNKEVVEEIYHLAETNSPLFLEKFYHHFPNFKDKFEEKHLNLNNDEIYFCVLLKLNFDTKKIAKILNQTVRAIESKKYRLKKKLNLDSDLSIQEYLIKF